MTSRINSSCPALLLTFNPLRSITPQARIIQGSLSVQRDLLQSVYPVKKYTKKNSTTLRNCFCGLLAYTFDSGECGTFGGGGRYVAAVLVLVAVNMALCGSICVMKYVFFIDNNDNNGNICDR